MRRAIVVAMAVAAATFVLGRASAPAVHRVREVAAPGHDPRPPRAPRAVERTLVEDAVRSAMAETPCAVAEPAATAPEPAPAPDPAPEVVQARRDAAGIAERAITRGSWTEADRQAVRDLGSSLDDEGVAALLTQLIPAVNAQQVAVEVRGSIL